jgi:RimJ/RimL family protein N-acetyltransferase
VLLDPANAYFAITDEHDELMGFCCFGPDARVPGGGYAEDGSLDIGAGMRPDLTGQGAGGGFIGAIVAFGEDRYAPPAFRASVAAFNQRSIRACGRAGFRELSRFHNTDGREFVILRRERESV